jgi:sodium/potassium/calcium exchanger 6
MVALYAVYVIYVAVGSWWLGRRERARERLRKVREEYADDILVDDFDPGAKSQWVNPDILLSADIFCARIATEHLLGSHHSPDISPRHSPLLSPQGPYSPALSALDRHPHVHRDLSDDDNDALTSLADMGASVTITSRPRSATFVTAPGTTHLPSLARRPRARSQMRPGLISAIEFRDVVNSLKADSSAKTLSVFGGIGRPEHMHGTYGNGHALRSRSRASSLGTHTPRPGDLLGHHRRHLSAIERPADFGDFVSNSSRALSGKHIMPKSAGWSEEPRDPFDEQFVATWRENAVSAGTRSASSDSLIDLSDGLDDDPWRNATPTHKSVGAGSEGQQQQQPGGRPERLTVDTANLVPVSPASSPPRRSIDASSAHKPSRSAAPAAGPVPAIIVTTETGQVDRPESSPAASWRTPALTSRVRWFADAFCTVISSLFPTLQNFGSRSLVGKIAALVAVPPIVLLNLTLPVLDDEAEQECEDVEEKETQLREALDDLDKGEVGEEGSDERDEDEIYEERRRHAEQIAHELHRPVAPHVPRVSSPRLDVSAVDRALGSITPDTEETATEYLDERAAGRGVAAEGDEVNEPPPTPVMGISDAQLTRVLNTVQCTLSPPFCILALLGGFSLSRLFYLL